VVVAVVVVVGVGAGAGVEVVEAVVEGLAGARGAWLVVPSCTAAPVSVVFELWAPASLGPVPELGGPVVEELDSVTEGLASVPGAGPAVASARSGPSDRGPPPTAMITLPARAEREARLAR